MRWKAKKSSLQLCIRGAHQLLGLGFFLLLAAPLAGCQTLSSSWTDWELSPGNAVEEAQAAEPEESPEEIATSAHGRA